MRTKRILLAVCGLAVLAGGDWLIRLRSAPGPENQRRGSFPEQLVFVRSKDDVVSGGALFTAPKETARPIAIVWIHGWGANFYLPSYVGIGRALAERGITTISANTRMHDIGNVAKYTGGNRVRAGGYWGITSEDARDIAAWVDFAQNRGFERVILVGHSAGWASVGRYEADTRDPRVAGLVLASPMVGVAGQDDDPELTAQARKLVESGAGEDLLRIPKRSFPAFISAATHLDMVNTPGEYKDFFGIQISDPGVARVLCPLLAFFGTKDDVGTETELNLLKSSIKRLSSGPSRVDTAMIERGNHEYVGEEAQVAQVIALWADGVSPKHVNKEATGPPRR
jgi:pimeloyl-ACP methyl ester carboxylesterase